MKIETVNLSHIQVNTANPREITDDKFAKLITSILVLPKMLEIRPIVVDNTMIALGGNMRFRALSAIADMTEQEISATLNNSRDFKKKTELEQQQLLDYWGKWKDKPTAYIINAKDLSEAEQREFIIKDNVGFGEWDFDALANEWDKEELDDWGVDLSWAKEDDKGSAEEDDVVEDEEVVARCKVGDIWQLGEHRLICGDSTDVTVIEQLCNGQQVDLYLTDPPYNVDYVGKTKDSLKIKNDKMNNNTFSEFLIKAFAAANSVMKKGAGFYIWHADSEGYNFRNACALTENWAIKQCLIWNKNSMVMGRQDYQWKHEPCLYGWKEGASHHWYNDRTQTTVIDYDRPTRNAEHPTMKPVGLFGYLIENSTKKGDVVLDTFAGSGTSIIACEQLDRICYSVELDPHYCDVIITRYETLTGKNAIKL